MPEPNIYPIEQETYINPYSNKIFDFDTSSSNVYVSRTVNNLLRAVGNDCVIDGLKVTATIDDSNKVLIYVSPGKAICDTTLVEINSSSIENKLGLDIDPFEQTGHLLVTLSFKFINTPSPNPVKLRLFYLSTNKVDTIPDFQTDYDRIILDVFTFDKVKHTITSVNSTVNDLKNIDIKDKNYIVRPRTDLLMSSLDEIKNVFAILNYD